MTLGRRAAILIFPVVLLGYLLAVYVVQVSQRQSLLALEKARLTQQLDHLAAIFENETGQARSLLYSVLEGSKFRLFMAETDESYRSHALGMQLQKTIQSLTSDPRKFVSFAVLDADLKLGYYFENSDDPFAEMSAEQRTLAGKLFAGPQIKDWSFLSETARPVIVYSEFVDPVTLNRPLPSAKRNAVIIQTAVAPDKFLAMRQALKAEYGSDLRLSVMAPAPSEALTGTVRLAPGIFATLTPAETHFGDQMRRQLTLLLIGALAISLVSIGVIILLVRRFITGPIAALDLQVTEVMNGERDVIAAVRTSGEISRLSGNIKRLYDQSTRSLRLVQQASWTDSLTGISNRAHFNLLASNVVQNAQARGDSCSLLFIDIDNFKFVNDKYGHQVGDHLLIRFAERLEQAVSPVIARRQMPKATLARLSGDEFAVLVQPASEDGSVEEIAAAILGLFAGGFEVGGKHYPVTASIGIAACPEDAHDIEDLVSKADAAMYQAKTSGKNRSARFSRALQDKRNRMRQIQAELQLMNPDDEFRLVYMPIVDALGRVTGCEALLRWHSPVLGDVRPDEFVPIAESSGLFTLIDCWVINRAMSDYAELAAIFGSGTMLAINISSAELHSSTICDHFADCAQRHAIDPRTIEIELTETYAVALGDQLNRNIDTLRERGFRISIDDFGAGYTSVQQIIEYPADTIKLDRALVQNLAASGTLSTLKAVVELCHAEKMVVIGEGVDTVEKMQLLIAAGCDLFQGYLVSQPLSLEALDSWAETRRRERSGEMIEMIGPKSTIRLG